MMVHGYKVGRYPAIIRKRYEDGTVNYETDFSSDADLIERERADRVHRSYVRNGNRPPSSAENAGSHLWERAYRDGAEDRQHDETLLTKIEKSEYNTYSQKTDDVLMADTQKKTPEEEPFFGGPFFVLTCPCGVGQATCRCSSRLHLLRPTGKNR